MAITTFVILAAIIVAVAFLAAALAWARTQPEI